jgi:hypothetical protein
MGLRPDMSPEQLAKLGQIQEKTPPFEESKKAGIQEEKALQEKIKSDKLRTELVGLQQDIIERKKYAGKSFRLVCFWISGVFLILLFQGFLSEPFTISTKYISGDFKFTLPSNVLLAVVGGTTVSIISIFLAVVNYLFPKR